MLLAFDKSALSLFYKQDSYTGFLAKTVSTTTYPSLAKLVSLVPRFPHNSIWDFYQMSILVSFGRWLVFWYTWILCSTIQKQGRPQ